MLKSRENYKQRSIKSALACIALAGCLLTSNLATAHPEKDRYGNDISSRIPDDVQTASLAVLPMDGSNLPAGPDDFRAPKMSREFTNVKDRLTHCGRQTPQHCPPRH